jgi:hypothetical protein
MRPAPLFPAALLLALALLTACGNIKREAAVAEPVVVVEEPAAVETQTSGLAPVTDCQPGDDDGIGGTGCKVD